MAPDEDQIWAGYEELLAAMLHRAYLDLKSNRYKYEALDFIRQVAGADIAELAERRSAANRMLSREDVRHMNLAR